MRAPQTTPPHSGDPARRKALGAWYTPVELVDHVVAMTVPHDAAGVLDPACGDGAFLTGVRCSRGDMVRLAGVDIDATAAAQARRLVPGSQIEHDDALTRDWGVQTFDAVVGNPPFLSQLSATTSRGGRSRFGGGPYADAAAEFLALAVSLARPDGGRVGMVVPQSLLSARDAGPIRDAIAEQASLVHVWWSPTPMFADAAVRTCVLVFERGAAPGLITRTFGPTFEPVDPVGPPGSTWASLIGLPGRPTPAAHGDGAVLGDVASFAVDFRDQYYGLVGAVGDDVDGPPLITSGLIDPGVCMWGRRPARFAKQRFAAPRVDLDRLTPRLQRWAQTRLVPKILIANQTRSIEAVVDHDGAWLPSVPVISCTAADVNAVMDVLCSPRATDWVQHHAAGSGLSATSVRLTPALLASIPLP